jgi:hypothetical protein
MSDQSSSGGSPIGPSITYHTKEHTQMATNIAGKTEWVETEGGVRRLVVEGQPIPVGLDLEDQASGEPVDPRSLTQPVVDEEASKSQAERTGADAPEPNAGISTENVEKAVGSRSHQRRSSGGSGSSGSSGSE